jgi:DNA polymerase (family 10)
MGVQESSASTVARREAVPLTPVNPPLWRGRTIEGMSRMGASTENTRIAECLLEAARLLNAQGASPHRAAAYRAAGNSIAHYPYGVRGVFEREGVKGLDAIPNVGLGIASAIAEMLVTQRWTQFERLRGEVDPATLFQAVPGVGEGLARRIRDELHVDTLEALEVAANDGRLEGLRGVGPRRAAAVRASLDHMLSSIRRPDPGARAPVALLLDVDREYRAEAAAGKLRTIAPRRFNPGHERWLPVLHTQRGAWHFTALFSNTALAHRLGRVRDWVVIYHYDGDHVERQCTVVTEPRGPLSGLRVVRGREDECLRLHESRRETLQALGVDHAA